MNEALRELEEDFRRERLSRLWHSFGKFVVGGSLAVIVATVALVAWQHWRQERAIEATGLLIQGVERMNAGDYKDAAAAFDALAEYASSYYGMALLRKAEAQKALGDDTGAQKTYQALAAYEGGDEGRPFAELGAVAAQRVDAPREDSPFFHSQREAKAWQLLAQGKKEEAAALLAALKDDDKAPASLRERAGQVLAQVAGSAP